MYSPKYTGDISCDVPRAELLGAGTRFTARQTADVSDNKVKATAESR
jgi:hypothetical protein